jgi:hypothetical protein
VCVCVGVSSVVGGVLGQVPRTCAHVMVMAVVVGGGGGYSAQVF